MQQQKLHQVFFIIFYNMTYYNYYYNYMYYLHVCYMYFLFLIKKLSRFSSLFFQIPDFMHTEITQVLNRLQMFLNYELCLNVKNRGN